MLYGRETELSVVAELIDRARTGASGALVLRGEPGIGKTALLAEAVARADGFRTIRVTGVETEAELTFAGLQLLLRSGLDRLDALPPVQADALRGALGLAAPTGPPDRFLIGLAVLSLLSELTTERPLLCVIDDAQWLDRGSADALLFVARRLDVESIVLLFAARTEGDFRADALTQLQLTGLSTAAAVDLLSGSDLPQQVRYRILAESAGNPLALLELPRAAAGEAAGDAGPPGMAAAPLPLTQRLRSAFEGRLRALPDATRTVLLIAAEEGTGDLTVILRAAAACGASSDDLERAREGGLVELSSGTLTFRHPLVRAAIHHAATLSGRRATHRALADALDRPEVADRRAWHLAAAAEGPDEAVAAELEDTAVRAGERSGAVGTWYARAAELSVDPANRARRLTAAAEALAESGEQDRAVELAERALRLLDSTDTAHFTDPTAAAVLAARLAQVLASADFLRGDLVSAQRRMTAAAERVGTVDPALAATLLLDAAHAAWYIGPNELSDAVTRLEALELDSDQRPAPLARLLIRAVGPIIGRPVADAAETDRTLATATAAAGDNPADLVLITGLALLLGRDRTAQRLAADLAGELRRRGLIGFLPATLFYAAGAQLYGGRVAEARQTLADATHLLTATAQQHWLAQFVEVQAILAAIDGDEARVTELIDAARTDGGDLAWRAPWAIWAGGLLDLGLGRAETALHRLLELNPGRANFHIMATRSTPDLVEAAVRVGRPEDIADGMRLLEKWAEHTGQPWTAAVVHRCRALLATTDDETEQHFRAALALAEAEDRPFEQARTRLLFGEWLRRAKRKAEARVQLEAALSTFERLRAHPWARRADNELTATGTSNGRARPDADRAVSAAAAVLTPQELQIVRLAAQGLSNKDIAAQLFLSPRTVGAHLYKAYPKLGILSRSELADMPLG